MKNKVLKNWVCMMLYFINVILVLFNIMLLAELNTCYLFYSISINIIALNTYIVHHFGSKAFNDEYMHIFTE